MIIIDNSIALDKSTTFQEYQKVSPYNRPDEIDGRGFILGGAGCKHTINGIDGEYAIFDGETYQIQGTVYDDFGDFLYELVSESLGE
ncbi:MAG: hypothetical protein ACSW8G_02395 [Bacillota bacterium]